MCVCKINNIQSYVYEKGERGYLYVYISEEGAGINSGQNNGNCMYASNSHKSPRRRMGFEVQFAKTLSKACEAIYIWTALGGGVCV